MSTSQNGVCRRVVFFLGTTHLLVAITELGGIEGWITLPLKKSITESLNENKAWSLPSCRSYGCKEYISNGFVVVTVVVT